MNRLPNYHYRSAWLRAFWTTQAVLAGLVLAMVAWLMNQGNPVAWGLTGSFVLLVPGLLRPSWVSVPFRIWRISENWMCERLSASIAAVFFIVVVLPIGRMMGGFRTLDGGRHGWIPRPVPTTTPDADQGARVRRRSTGEEPRSAEISWARVAFPFLSILKWIGGGQQAVDVPIDTYTLY